MQQEAKHDAENRTSPYVIQTRPTTGIEATKKSATKARKAPVQLVRQPNKQGMERHMDPSFQDKLSGMEAQF